MTDAQTEARAIAGYEVFSDPAYFDMWAVRPVGTSELTDTIHVASKEEAKAIATALAVILHQDARIAELEAEVERLKLSCSAWEDSARINKARADAAEALSSTGAVKVKALEWASVYGYAARAASPVEIYAITEYAGMAEPFRLEGIDNSSLYFSDLDAAKAAAQADYERRILSSLTTEPAAPEDDSGASPFYRLMRDEIDRVNDPVTQNNLAYYLAQIENTRPDHTSGEVTEVTHRHKKRGTEYVLLGIGRMQAEGWSSEVGTTDQNGEPMNCATSVDMQEVAIYRSVDDGSLWVRPREEFEDGRFEDLRGVAS